MRLNRFTVVARWIILWRRLRIFVIGAEEPLWMVVRKLLVSYSCCNCVDSVDTICWPWQFWHQWWHNFEISRIMFLYICHTTFVCLWSSQTLRCKVTIFFWHMQNNCHFWQILHKKECRSTPFNHVFPTTFCTNRYIFPTSLAFRESKWAIYSKGWACLYSCKRELNFQARRVV